MLVIHWALGEEGGEGGKKGDVTRGKSERERVGGAFMIRQLPSPKLRRNMAVTFMTALCPSAICALGVYGRGRARQHILMCSVKWTFKQFPAGTSKPRRLHTLSLFEHSKILRSGVYGNTYESRVIRQRCDKNVILRSRFEHTFEEDRNTHQPWLARSTFYGSVILSRRWENVSNHDWDACQFDRLYRVRKLQMLWSRNFNVQSLFLLLSHSLSVI